MPFFLKLNTMYIYSNKIIRFINELKSLIKDVLSREVGLKIHGDRFYDRTGRCSYPIKVVIYNHKSMLGYFESEFLELGFHERLMHTNKETLCNIVRHEIAHYMTFIEFGDFLQPHSMEFKAFCQRMGWGEEVYRATTCLEDGCPISEESAILRKVKKLMSLASSSNKHEAEQAMIKSQQLLQTHNIDATYVGTDDSEKMVLKRIMLQKKENAKMRAIAIILETFFVSTVYNRSEKGICLEILGTPVNVEIAEYVAGVLELEMEKLWIQAKYQANLTGTVAKNSFFMGISKGYCTKIQALKREYSSEVVTALLVIENQLVNAKAMVYKNLRTSKSAGGYCPEASALGHQMGRSLNINPALNKMSASTGLLM